MRIKSNFWYKLAIFGQFRWFLTMIWTANLNELGLCGQSTLDTVTSMSVNVTSYFELFFKLFSNGDGRRFGDKFG